jgi:hypothetical protein
MRLARTGCMIRALPVMAVALATACTTISPDVDEVDEAASADDALSANRYRLLETYSRRLDPNRNACKQWNLMSASQRGAFLTITHRLQIASILNPTNLPDPLLDHMTMIYAVHGSEDRHGLDLLFPCGGINANRVFFSMDSNAWLALGLARVGDPSHPAIADFGATGGTGTVVDRRWRNTHDTPHRPFDVSDEANQGGPRGQVQYFSDAVARPLPNRGANTADINDGYVLEMDQDYDIFHNSNTECPGFRAKYERNYTAPGFAAVNYDWVPDCSKPPQGGGSSDCSGCTDCRDSRCFETDDHGFACCAI